MADPYRFFRIEAVELTDALEAGLLELDRGEGSAPAAVAAVLRHAHTLKGAARVVRHTASANLAHDLEDLLVPVRDAGVELSQGLVSQALGIVDALRRAVAELENPVPAGATAQPGATAAMSAEAATTETEAPRERPPDAPANGATVRRMLEHTTALGDQVTRLDGVREHLGEVRRRLNGGYRIRPQLVGSTALVPRLDAEVLPFLDEVVQVERELSVGIEAASRLLRQLREGLERLRLRATDELRAPLERTARDAAVAVGKRVHFEFQGGGLSIEPELHASVARALIQAVKNAVVHGIEPPAARTAVGKAADGRITVTALRQGSSIVFSCEDDGSGLDLDAVQKTLISREPSGASHRTEAELIDALLSGGVSTAASVTAVAGRGIGLDLVREVAKSIGGRLRLQNRPGRGVRLELETRAELAAAPALLVLANDVVYALPLGALFRTTRHELLEERVSHELLVDGAMVPFWPLAALIEPDAPLGVRKRSWTVVLCRHEGAVLALGVDRLLGTENVVSQTLPSGAQTTPALTGFSSGLDGTPRFLLDPAWLHRAARAPWQGPSSEASPPEPILVIDDSLTTRMLERSILESAGYHVDLATSGEEGLEMARAKRYALFLVDVEMPGMDGFTFIQTTQADPTLRSIPAILVTSRNAPEDIARGARVGARAHIVKGEFDQVDLLARIERLVEKT